VGELDNGAGAPAPGWAVDRDHADQARLRQIADEQAALRRVATLVARGAAPEEVFTAVAEEVGRLFPVDRASMGRYEPGGASTILAAWGTASEHFPVGMRFSLGGHDFATLVFETGRPARIDNAADAARGPLAVPVRMAGIRSAVGVPVIVERRLPDHVEVAAYYAASEALANAAKHARASAVLVELDADDAMLRLTVRDDGIGGADPAQGSGLTGLRDRIEAVGGTFDVTSPADGGTTLLIKIPVSAERRFQGSGSL
jgi:hypothetical protein